MAKIREFWIFRVFQKYFIWPNLNQTDFFQSIFSNRVLRTQKRPQTQKTRKNNFVTCFKPNFQNFEKMTSSDVTWLVLFWHPVLITWTKDLWFQKKNFPKKCPMSLSNHIHFFRKMLIFRYFPNSSFSIGILLYTVIKWEKANRFES